MLTVTVFAENGSTTYRALAVAPFGAACILLTGAWTTDYTGTRHETEADARTIILPAPVAGERIEYSEDAPAGG
jgi:hypothetical protein